MSRYGAFTGPNTGNYGPEKTPYLDTFHAVDDPPKVYSEPVEYLWWSILSCENREGFRKELYFHNKALS